MREKHFKSHLLSIAILIVGFSASAADPLPSQIALTELKLFERCYGQLTQMALLPTHALRAKVASGALTAAAACMQVFDSASLQNASASTEGNLITVSAESKAVLRTFNDYHRSWFPNDSIEVTGNDFRRSGQVHDLSESALHVSRALFTPGVNYSEVVTGSSAMEAIRSKGPSAVESQMGSNKFKTYSGIDFASQVELNPQLVQVGELLGMRPMTRNPTKNNLVAYSHHGGGHRYDGDTVLVKAPISVHQSLGAGIIGTRSYLMLNLGRNYEVSDGGIRVARRWAKAVLKDVLCREVPVIRSADAARFVQKTLTAATPPFRSGTSCMACHATMDPMGYAARNVTLRVSPFNNADGDINTLGIIHQFTPSLSAESGTVDKDPDFYKRPPVGHLLFRSYDGTLVDQSVQGLPELGSAIAGTNDYYACAASRYYQFFTGVGVNLQDNADPDLPALSAAELNYRTQVISLGQKLKQGGSLRAIIQSILESDTYRKASMRDVGK